MWKSSIPFSLQVKRPIDEVKKTINDGSEAPGIRPKNSNHVWCAFSGSEPHEFVMEAPVRFKRRGLFFRVYRARLVCAGESTKIVGEFVVQWWLVGFIYTLLTVGFAAVCAAIEMSLLASLLSIVAVLLYASVTIRNHCEVEVIKEFLYGIEKDSVTGWQ